MLQAHCAILVFDCTRKNTYKNLSNWYAGELSFPKFTPGSNLFGVRTFQRCGSFGRRFPAFVLSTRLTGSHFLSKTQLLFISKPKFFSYNRQKIQTSLPRASRFLPKTTFRFTTSQVKIYKLEVTYTMQHLYSIVK